jgi:hypothetical protein
MAQDSPPTLTCSGPVLAMLGLSQRYQLSCFKQINGNIR